MLVIVGKGFLALAYANKTKLSTKVNLLHLLYSRKNFSKNSNLDDSVTSLPDFPSRTYLSLHISITPKLVKKFIMDLDSSKASCPDCIPVVVLKSCEPELSYILAELFNKCLKESCFPDFQYVLRSSRSVVNLRLLTGLGLLEL